MAWRDFVRYCKYWDMPGHFIDISLADVSCDRLYLKSICFQKVRLFLHTITPYKKLARTQSFTLFTGRQFCLRTGPNSKYLQTTNLNVLSNMI